VAARIRKWFDGKGTELKALFSERGIDDARTSVFHAQPSDADKLRWFRRDIADSARTAGHYADFSGFSAWSHLRVRLAGQRLRFVASLHGAGRNAGVMAVTTFGDLSADTEGGEGDSERAEPLPPVRIQTTPEAFLFVHTEAAEVLDARMPELEELLDAGLTVALGRLMAQL
jgi:hypothetical protein